MKFSDVVFSFPLYFMVLKALNYVKKKTQTSMEYNLNDQGKQRLGSRFKNLI